MPRSNYGDLVPANGVYDGSLPQRRIGIYDGDDEPDGDYEPHHDFQPYDLPATENPADFCTASAPAPSESEPDERYAPTAMIINLGDSSSEVEIDENTQVQAEAEVVM